MADMVQLDLLQGRSEPEQPVAASVLLDRGHVKVRRISLASGAKIPPCQMQEDVVFVVVAGRVTFRTEAQEMVVDAPGALFIPGGATTRSMEAQETSLVLAVLARRETDRPRLGEAPIEP